MEKNTYEVAITAIIVKDGKYLVTRRNVNKKKWPLKWTVPGGRLEPSDYLSIPKDTTNAWYNILEKVVKREVKEEVGIEIKSIDYLTSLIAQHGEEFPLIISLIADYDSGEIKLQEEECDKFAWVSLEEAKEYDLIDGIYDELIMAENKRKGMNSEWRRFSNHQKERKGDWAQTYTGKKFWPLDPKSEEVNLDDVAHSLALQCRFNGHSIPFYSIAQHSVLVSKIVSHEQALAGLFHDASEAYTGDIVSPLKSFLPPEFKKIEKAIEKVIFEHFGIKNVNHSEIKRADKIALFTESRDIMEKSPSKWNDEDLFEPHPEKIVPLSPEEAEEEFLERYKELIQKTKSNQ